MRLVIFPPWRARHVPSCEPFERLIVRNPRPLSRRRRGEPDDD